MDREQDVVGTELVLVREVDALAVVIVVVKTAVTCLERIARFHIVSLHLLSNPANTEQFDRHQERVMDREQDVVGTELVLVREVDALAVVIVVVHERDSCSEMANYPTCFASSAGGIGTICCCL
jgi:hypothetical protein